MAGIASMAKLPAIGASWQSSRRWDDIPGVCRAISANIIQSLMYYAWKGRWDDSPEWVDYTQWYRFGR